MSSPSDRRFSPEHTWARLEDGGVVLVGVTDFAQEQLGDVIYVELPKPGQQVKAGSTFGVVESAKTASDLIAPVSGEVVQVNQGLEDKPELVNNSPYEEGWIVRVRPSDLTEMDQLLSAADYDSKTGSD